MHTMLCANKLGALGLVVGDAIAVALGDVSPSAASVLLTLRYKGAFTASGVAAIVGIAQPTAVRVIDGLVRRKLIERRARTGRTAPLRLTRAGTRLADALQQARLSALIGLIDGLPLSERSAFERLLDHLLAQATHSRAFARTVCRLCHHRACDGPLCPIGRTAATLG